MDLIPSQWYPNVFERTTDNASLNVTNNISTPTWTGIPGRQFYPNSLGIGSPSMTMYILYVVVCGLPTKYLVLSSCSGQYTSCYRVNVNKLTNNY